MNSVELFRLLGEVAPAGWAAAAMLLLRAARDVTLIALTPQQDRAKVLRVLYGRRTRRP